ncbi:dynamin family protein [Rossellomorea sp. NPDC077527]|uniref:dynamin family protein n=1 Tax=Rossellomorea sp. NPDC077527 TaxID=3364510 RepID=UPI0037C95C20
MNGLERHEQSLQNIQKVFHDSNVLGVYAREIDTIIKHMNEPINVMILGEFNAGKSTLINTILEDEYLKTDDIPTTATITKLTYGETPEIRLHFKDGEEQVLSPEKFEQITAEIDEEGAEIRKRLSYVHVQYPSELLKKVTLIDTPGRNSNNVNHTEAAESFMDQADAAFWLFELSQIGTSTELSQLKKLNDYVHPIGIINRIDEMDEDDTLENIVQSARTSLSPFVTEFIGISALNAYEGIVEGDEDLLEESNWSSFEKALEKEINGEHVQSRKMERIYQDIEKTLEKVKKLVEETKKSFHDTSHQLQASGDYKTTLMNEVNSLDDLTTKWVDLADKGRIYELHHSEWPLPSPQDEGLKEKWEEQLFYMEELFGKEELLRLEKNTLQAEERELNQLKRELGEAWNKYNNSGLFGGEPIIFTGEKYVLEAREEQLNSDIQSHSQKEHALSYRQQSLEDTKDQGLEMVKLLARKVADRLDEMKKEKVALHNDKGYLEKAQSSLVKTEWLPRFLEQVQKDIIPVFEEGHSVLKSNSAKTRHSNCLDLLKSFLDDSITLDAYRDLQTTIQKGIREKGVKVKKKTPKQQRHRDQVSRSFSWFRVWSTVAMVVIVCSILYSFQEPLKKTVSSLFAAEEPISAEATAGTTPETVTVVVNAANVRQEPNLDSTIVTTVQLGEGLSVVNSSTDSEGRRWLKVEVLSGEIGWISEKVVE